MDQFFKKINLIPNWITLLRILTIWPFIYFLAFRTTFFSSNPFYSKLLAVILFILIILSDYLDGFLARLLKQENLFGQVLDYVADKLVIIITYIVLYMLYPGTIPLWLLLIIVIRELVISLLRFSNPSEHKVIFIGRLKTFFHFFTGLIILLLLLLQEFLVVYMHHKFVSFKIFFQNYLSDYYFQESFELIILLNGFFTVLSGIIYIYQYRKIIQ